MVFAFRSISLTVLTVMLIDHLNPENDIVTISRDSPVVSESYQFVCIVTNCTRLSPPISDQKTSTPLTLGEDILKLPLLKWCYPKLSSIFNPLFRDIGSHGLMLSTVFSWSFLYLQLFTPISNYLKPENNQSIVFVTCPNLLRKIYVIDRVAIMIDNLKSSLNNYKRVSLMRENRFKDFITDWDDHSHLNNYQVHMGASNENEYTLKTTLNLKVYQLPNSRSEWWRERLALLFVIAHLRSLLIEVILVIVGHLILTNIVNNVNKDWDRIDREMRKQNCFLWHQDDQERNSPLKIELFGEISSYSIHNFELLTVLSNCIAANLIFCYAECIFYEIFCQIAELRQLLILTIEAAEMRSHFRSICNDSSNNINYNTKRNHDSQSVISEIQRKFCNRFQRNCNFSSIFLLNFGQPKAKLEGGITLTGDLGERVDDQMLMIELIANRQFDLNFQIQLMEKLYIDSRLFLEQFEQYSKGLTRLIHLVYISNYSVVILAILADQFLRDYTTQALFWVAGAWLVAIIILAAASSAQAKVRFAHTLPETSSETSD